MTIRAFILFEVVLASLVFVAVLFSHHGFIDLAQFRKEVSVVREASSLIEDENRRLSRQLNLLESQNDEIRGVLLDRKIREGLGFIRPDELIYYEKKDH